MDDPLAEIEETAVTACETGGEYLRTAFDARDADTEYLAHDVKSSADTGSETRMLDVIASAHPDHAVYAEESGEHDGDGPYRWIVDPLDGTNNFASGLPSFATAAAVLRDGEPVLAVVYVPLLDDLYVARRGAGVRFNGERVLADGTAPLDRATVVSVIGHDVKLEPERLEVARAIDRAVEDRCKRRLESWSPTVHWGLLARGRLDGIVCYRPDDEEQLAGELFARESGMAVERGEEWFVATTTDGALAPLVEAVRTSV